VSGVPIPAALIRSTISVALLPGLLFGACSKPEEALLEEVKPIGQTVEAGPIASEETAGLSDLAPAPADDIATDSLDQNRNLDVRLLESVADTGPAPPADPLAILPPEAPLLPADHGLETLYQCVDANLARVPSARFRRHLHVRLAAAIARRDPPRGLATLNRATTSNPSPEEAVILTLAVASRDLRRAVTIATGFTSLKNRRRSLEGLVNLATEKSGGWGIIIANQMRERIPREIFLLNLIERLAETRPVDSLLFADRVIEPLLNDWAMALVAAAEADQHLDQALARIEEIENPVVRDWALLRLNRGLAGSTPTRVDELIPQIQRSLVRDELLGHLALAVVADTPDRGLAIALRIEDPEMLRRGLDALAQALLPHKPALARFMVEKKREPPLSPEVWLSWLKAACRDHPDSAAEMLGKALDELSLQEELTGLLNCCPGAPMAVRSVASNRDIHDDHLTRCYVCGGVTSDAFIAARMVRDDGIRNDALLCAIDGLTAKDAKPAVKELTNLTEPLLKDLAAASLVGKLHTAGENIAALELAGSIVDPYLRAPALALLVVAENEAVASTAMQAFDMAIEGISDRWRKDSALESLVRSSWNHDQTKAWKTLTAIEDSVLVARLIEELMTAPLSADRIQDLMGSTPPGAPLALACLRSIALEPMPVEVAPVDSAPVAPTSSEPEPAKPMPEKPTPEIAPHE